MKWKKSLSNRGSHETQVRGRMLKNSAVLQCVLQCVAMCCSALQCGAVYCILQCVLQCVTYRVSAAEALTRRLSQNLGSDEYRISPHHYFQKMHVAWKNKMLALSVSSACCSHVRALAAGLPRQDHIWITTNNWFVSTTTNSMPCKLYSTEYALFFKSHPSTLQGRFGFLQFLQT